jgi:propanediol dehydratase small subunit
MNDRPSDSPQYPLGESAADQLHAASGRPLSEVTLAAAAANELSAVDLSISDQSLQAQASIAQENGYEELAENLRRAAELTRVPNDVLLQMYEELRPRRATYEELMALADRLDSDYEAPITGAFVREAAEVYRERGILRKEAPANG